MSDIAIMKSMVSMLVRGDLTHADITASCEAAASAHLAAVQVLPVHVKLAAAVLAGADTRIIATIGAPWGQETVDVKLAACDAALADGAHALAVTPDHSLLLSGKLSVAANECARLLSTASWQSMVAPRGRSNMTVVLETLARNPRDLRPIFDVLHESAAGFVQTSAGHAGRMVTVDHVRALRELLPADLSITAVGGVARIEDARQLIEAGAIRVGSAAAVAIARDEHQRTRSTTTTDLTSHT